MTKKKVLGWMLVAVLAGVLAVQDASAQTGAVPGAAPPVSPVPVVPNDAKVPKAPVPVVNEQGKIVVEAPIPEPAAGDALFAPLATAGPDPLGRKFRDYYVVSFGPRALFTPAIAAAIKQARPNTEYPEDWQTGFGAFGRNYGSAVGTKVAGQTARFVVGATLHEDFRYRPTWGTPLDSGKHSFGKRLVYAVGFAFVDRSDEGHLRPALANFSEAAASGFVGNLWLPDGFNGARDGGRRTGVRFGGIVFQNVAREFSPEVFRAFQWIHLPFPRVPLPEWWDGSIHKPGR